MAQVNDKIFEKVKQLAHEVKQELRAKGIVVPVVNPDGSYCFDGFSVKKQTTGFYKVTDIKNRTLVDNLNLPQSAAIIANDLALGKIIDNSIINADAAYGYKLFDCEVYKRGAERARKKDVDKFVYYETRSQIAKAKKLEHKNTILQHFNKLRRLR